MQNSDESFQPQTTREQRLAAEIVRKGNLMFDKIVSNIKEMADITSQKIGRLEQKMSEEKDDSRIEIFTRQISDAKRTLRRQSAMVEFTRLPFEKDVEYRLKVAQGFPNKVKETVPDGLPLVFHGTGNIGEIRQIIKTHGLLTPEQKGESMTSFAVQIDVGAKTNIRVPCEFAEPGYFWLPYGGIFAFMPRPDEVDKVNETGDSTQVFGGVDGVDFSKEPERLFGIITTPENIERFKSWCTESGLDSSKVMTHDEFIESMSRISLGSSSE